MPQQKKRIKNPENPNPGAALRPPESKAPVDPVEARPQVQAEPHEEQIRRRAYEIYLARGDAPGDPVADWLQAEQEVHDKEQGSSMS